MRGKAIIFTILFLIAISITGPIAQASVTKLPYRICGMVRDENGDNITGAVVIIERLSTGETNLKYPDGTPKTLTSSPPKQAIETNENGLYLYQLSNMEGYEDGDRFKISASKDDKSGTKIITIDTDNPPGYDNADITIRKSILDLNFLLIIIIIVIIIITIIGISRK